uniref:Uncharacterized protein n=1 Tax=Heterorhabditis bacteriophora TaxID=37862 RepID=A0A1I7X7E3_HETBA
MDSKQEGQLLRMNIKSIKRGPNREKQQTKIQRSDINTINYETIRNESKLFNKFSLDGFITVDEQ